MGLARQRARGELRPLDCDDPHQLAQGCLKVCLDDPASTAKQAGSAITQPEVIWMRYLKRSRRQITK